MVAWDPESCVELKAIIDHQELHPVQWGHADQHQEAKATEAATEHSDVGVCLIHMLLSPLGWHQGTRMLGGEGRLQGQGMRETLPTHYKVWFVLLLNHYVYFEEIRQKNSF